MHCNVMAHSADQSFHVFPVVGICLHLFICGILNIDFRKYVLETSNTKDNLFFIPLSFKRLKADLDEFVRIVGFRIMLRIVKGKLERCATILLTYSQILKNKLCPFLY